MDKKECVPIHNHHSLMSKLISIVKIVDAVTRKPEEYEIYTFFSLYDQWQMNMVFDDRTCPICLQHQGTYAGNELRSNFPYLEIQDREVIYAHVHPNCRCYLLRTVNIMDPRMSEEEKVKKYGT